MKNFVKNVLIGTILSAGIAAAALVAMPPTINSTIASVVEVVTFKDGKEIGHGTGTYIGEGRYVTADHVTSTGGDIKIRFQNGSLTDAIVHKNDAEADVSVITAPFQQGDIIPPANLFCGVTPVGVGITSVGYPLNLGLVQTRGYIVGVASKFSAWRSVYRVDASLAPGMSGGPAFANDDFVGVNVGMSLFPMGLSATITGINLIVPTSEVCKLLGEE